MVLPKSYGIAAGWPLAPGQFAGQAPIKTAFRAIGTRAQLPNVMAGGQANQAYGFRHNIYSPVAIDTLQLVIPTFCVDANGGAQEVDLVQDARFQAGIDELNTQSMSGLPARVAVLFGGSNIATYSKTTGPFPALVSDVFTCQQPRNWLSIYLAKEWIGTPPDFKSPRNCFFSNVAGKYEKGELFTTASGVLPINSGWALTQTDLGAETLNSSGRTGFCPFIIARLVDGTTSVLILGTSSSQGINEVTGPVTDNNPYGDARGSRGWPARYIGTKLNTAYANFGISGDQLGIALTGTNFQRRLALAKILNPTHCHFQHGANDIAGGASVATTLSRCVQMMDKLRTVLPTLKFVPSLMQPSSTGAWTAVDGSDQTQNTAFNTNAAALTFDNNIRNAVYPWDGTYGPVGKYLETTIPLVNPTRNPNPLTACDYTWKANGTALYFTPDGRHMNTNAEYELLLPYLSSTSPFV